MFDQSIVSLEMFNRNTMLFQTRSGVFVVDSKVESKVSNIFEIPSLVRLARIKTRLITNVKLKHSINFTLLLLLILTITAILVIVVVGIVDKFCIA